MSIIIFNVYLGKVVPTHGVCYVAWGGGEHGKSEYEVLVGSASWVPGTGSDIPPTALPGEILLKSIKKLLDLNSVFFSAGETEDGEPLFVGRARHEGTVTVGKIQPSHGVCYISYAGQELGFADYEVLVA
jgi:hypothetical protein